MNRKVGIKKKDIWYVSFVRLFSLYIGQFVLDFILSKLELRNDAMRTAQQTRARFVWAFLINKQPDINNARKKEKNIYMHSFIVIRSIEYPWNEDLLGIY